MSAAEGAVVLRGRELRVREGDLITLCDRHWLSRLLSPFQGGWAHVATVVALDNRLCALSVYMAPAGLTVEPIERYASRHYTRLGIVRPSPPRNALQTLRLRHAVRALLRAHAADAHECYESDVREFVATVLGLPAATEAKFTCSELAARLARAAGAWPEGQTVSVRVDELARIVGRMERVF